MEFTGRLAVAITQRPKLKRWLAGITLAGFPVLLVFLIEGIHMDTPIALVKFFIQSPGVFVFDVLLLTVGLGVLLMLTRQAWIAMFLEGGLLYTLSLVEYFKFDANGTHFAISDLVMAGKLSDVARFARVELTLSLIFPFALLIGYVLWTAFLHIRVDLRLPTRIAAGASGVLLLTAVFAIPTVYGLVYKTFGVTYQTSYSPYGADESFQSNRQIAFLSQDLSAEISRAFDTPKGYSEASIQALLPHSGTRQRKSFAKPDVIMIMSEAYADFRCFEDLPIPAGTYDQFDRLAQEGNRGTAMVPTFGGYTCKTEFELLFGLPVKGIGDEDIPHQLFTDGQPRPTFAATLREHGYKTTFLHPFSSSFYNRDKAYRSYGFDRLLFEQDLTVEKTALGSYTDDATLVRQIQKLLEESTDRPQFFFAVSMQNHGPYAQDDPSLAVPDARLSSGEQAELGRYLDGIGKTDQALGELATYLRQRERPTVLLFVGDHYPYLGEQGAMYRKFARTDDYALYRQSYLLWSSDQSAYHLPQQEVSAFYLPHLVADRIGLPRDRFFTDMWQMLQETPVYTFDQGDQGPNAHALTSLAFDRTQGGCYSSDTLRNQSGFSLKLLVSQLQQLGSLA